MPRVCLLAALACTIGLSGLFQTSRIASAGDTRYASWQVLPPPNGLAHAGHWECAAQSPGADATGGAPGLLGGSSTCEADATCDLDGEGMWARLSGKMRRCRKKMYVHWQGSCRHFLYPVCPPYHAPTFGHYETCWRAMPPTCRVCPPAIQYLSPDVQGPVVDPAALPGGVPPAPAADGSAVAPAAPPGIGTDLFDWQPSRQPAYPPAE